MSKPICDVPECGRPVRARGWCTMHYTRWRKSGEPGPAERWPKAPRGTCSVEGCGRKGYVSGHCQMHWRRVRMTGAAGPADPQVSVPMTCSFSGCEQRSRGKGLCGGHYRQSRLGQPLTALRPVHKSTARDAQGRKRCSACGIWKPLPEFYPSRRHADGLVTTCRRCDRDARLRRSYGISVDQYEAMLAAQGGGCAICGGAPKDSPSLHVDHDHACCPGRKKSCGHCVRGLLCEDCNRVLGMFSDDPARFESAITYLKQGGAHRDHS